MKGLEPVLERLISAVDAERGKDVPFRTTGANDESLESVAGLLRRADRMKRHGRTTGASDLLDSAARLVADSWSSDSALAVEVVGFAQQVRR